MQRFIDTNPGLASRFRTTITFEDYSDDEITAILESMAEANDYDLSDKAVTRFREILAATPRDESFGQRALCAQHARRRDRAARVAPAGRRGPDHRAVADHRHGRPRGSRRCSRRGSEPGRRGPGRSGRARRDVSRRGRRGGIGGQRADGQRLGRQRLGGQRIDGQRLGEAGMSSAAGARGAAAAQPAPGGFDDRVRDLGHRRSVTGVDGVGPSAVAPTGTRRRASRHAGIARRARGLARPRTRCAGCPRSGCSPVSSPERRPTRR